VSVGWTWSPRANLVDVPTVAVPSMSGVALAACASTNAVVASCVVLVSTAAVGAVGVPVTGLPSPVTTRHPQPLVLPVEANHAWAWSSPTNENIPLFDSPKSDLELPHPVPSEGRWPSSQTLGRVAVDAMAAKDERCCCVRRSRVGLTPRCWRQVL
jgi:hypothetical protein